MKRTRDEKVFYTVTTIIGVLFIVLVLWVLLQYIGDVLFRGPPLYYQDPEPPLYWPF